MWSHLLVAMVSILLQAGSAVTNGPDNWLLQMDNDTISASPSVSELSSSLAELKSIYSDMSSQFETYRQTASSNIATLQSRLRDLENIVGNITPAPRPEHIGFSVSLSAKQAHVRLGAKVIFDRLYFQSGDAYNQRTGIFTAPSSGLYLFSIFCHSSGAQTLVLSVMVDGAFRTACVSEPAYAGEDDTGGNMFVSHLNTGQQVWVQTFEVNDASIFPTFTTFTGVLIQGD